MPFGAVESTRQGLGAGTSLVPRVGWLVGGFPSDEWQQRLESLTFPPFPKVEFALNPLWPILADFLDAFFWFAIMFFSFVILYMAKAPR